VVDATNLERNLYLTVQLLELEVPVVVALNMSGALHKDGTKIRVDELSQLLGNVPVVHTSANYGRGVTDLVVKAIQAAKKTN
jgi:ferrous iron transport protein B